jgi:hypothetical protein
MKANGKDGKSVHHDDLFTMVQPAVKIFKLDRRMFKEAVSFLLGGEDSETYLKRE